LVGRPQGPVYGSGSRASKFAHGMETKVQAAPKNGARWSASAAARGQANGSGGLSLSAQTIDAKASMPLGYGWAAVPAAAIASVCRSPPTAPPPLASQSSWGAAASSGHTDGL